MHSESSERAVELGFGQRPFGVEAGHAPRAAPRRRRRAACGRRGRSGGRGRARRARPRRPRARSARPARRASCRRARCPNRWPRAASRSSSLSMPIDRVPWSALFDAARLAVRPVRRMAESPRPRPDCRDATPCLRVPPRRHSRGRSWSCHRPAPRPSRHDTGTTPVVNPDANFTVRGQGDVYESRVVSEFAPRTVRRTGANAAPAVAERASRCDPRPPHSALRAALAAAGLPEPAGGVVARACPGTATRATSPRRSRSSSRAPAGAPAARARGRDPGRSCSPRRRAPRRQRSTSPGPASSTSTSTPAWTHDVLREAVAAGDALRPLRGPRRAADQPRVRLREPDRPAPRGRWALGRGRRRRSPTSWPRRAPRCTVSTT